MTLNEAMLPEDLPYTIYQLKQYQPDDMSIAESIQSSQHTVAQSDFPWEGRGDWVDVLLLLALPV